MTWVGHFLLRGNSPRNSRPVNPDSPARFRMGVGMTHWGGRFRRRWDRPQNEGAYNAC